MLRLNTPLHPHLNRTPQLPPELIWAIIELSLTDLGVVTSSSPGAIASPIPLHLLTLSRGLYALVIKLAYRTIIISSSRSLAGFFTAVTHSPHLSSLVCNLWVGTPHLEAFNHQYGWVPCIIGRILASIPGLKRLALPASFLPPNFGISQSAIKHITFGGGSVPDLPLEVETIHVHGLILPSRIKYLKKGVLRRIVCDLRRPCAPGEIGHLIQALFGSASEGRSERFRLELVVPEGLETWLEDEMSQVAVDSLARESLVIRARKAQNVKSESSCDEWVRECQIS